MPKQRQVFVVLMVAGGIASLGGIVRLLGEAAGSILSTVRLETLDAPSWISLGVSCALVVTVLVAMLPWYRRLYLRRRADVAALRGIPVKSLPSLRAGLRRSARVIVVVLGGAIVLAVLLPGPLSAALAIVAGLVLGVLAAVVAWTSTSSPGPASTT